MGGDLFQGTQKLTNSQYLELTSQLAQILSPFCQRIQPYTPMPQKQIHGDIDFIVLLKPPSTQDDILTQLKPKQCKISNNENSISTVYKNKQIDFLFVGSQNQFQLVWFYKSYSGFGGYLGTFFPSKIIKVTHKGLYAPICYFHLKVQLLVSNNVEEIMRFYGLDYERHKKGYKTRKELYEFLRTARFLDEQRYVQEVKQVKGTSKLMWGMVQYLKQTGLTNEPKPLIPKDIPKPLILKDIPKPLILKDILKESLHFFGKTQTYNQALNKLIKFKKQNEQMNKKFNAKNILQHFDIPIKKQVDHMKTKFKTVMFQQDQEKYLDYVDSHSVEEILDKFGQVCGLKVKDIAKQQFVACLAEQQKQQQDKNTEQSK